MTAGPAALLVLEDGSAFRGTAFGSTGEGFGEAVFNTGMSGYQEVLTDPSYAGQVVAMTAPHQGNYGTNDQDPESGRVHVSGFVVREVARRASNWRATGSLADELERAGVVGLEGVDTRRLTLRLRDRGAMRCGLSTDDLDAGSLLERVRSQPPMQGADLAKGVSSDEPYAARDLVGPASDDLGPVYRVAAYDFGLKRNILRRLAAAGIEATVVPATTPAAEVRSGGYDGVFLSNGPGDPAATTYGIDACREAARDDAGLRHLPGAPAPRPRARWAHLQAPLRAPGREPTREGPSDRPRRGDEPQPRLRGRARRVAPRRERSPGRRSGASSSPTGT